MLKEQIRNQCDKNTFSLQSSPAAKEAEQPRGQPEDFRNVYITCVESVFTFHVSVWVGYLSCKCKTKLNKSKIVRRLQKPLLEIYTERTRRKARKITGDSSHPLSNQFKLLRSGRRLFFFFFNLLSQFIPINYCFAFMFCSLHDGI